MRGENEQKEDESEKTRGKTERQKSTRRMMKERKENIVEQ